VAVTEDCKWTANDPAFRGSKFEVQGSRFGFAVSGTPHIRVIFTHSPGVH
jgi:hypothetical protein